MSGARFEYAKQTQFSRIVRSSRQGRPLRASVAQDIRMDVPECAMSGRAHTKCAKRTQFRHFRRSSRQGRTLRPRHAQIWFVLIVALLLIATSRAGAALPPPTVTLTPVSNDGHFTSGINSVAIDRNNLVTYGNYQFIAFYDRFRSLVGPDDQATVMLGRRLLGTVSEPGVSPRSRSGTFFSARSAFRNMWTI